MNILIRPAQPIDIPVMCDLLRELFTLESDFEPAIEKQVKGLALLLAGPSEDSTVLVAMASGKVVGMASVQTLISTAEGSRVGLVEDVILDRRFRGRGIGKLLLNHIVEWSRQRNLKRLQLLADKSNLPAIDFYRHNGWTETGLNCMRIML